MENKQFENLKNKTKMQNEDDIVEYKLM